MWHACQRTERALIRKSNATDQRVDRRMILDCPREKA
jgi:hypothetical protein